MAHVEAMKRYVKSSSGTSEQTVEQILHYDDLSWSQHTSSPTLGKVHDQEEHDNHGKKSVLTKVKDKAKKLRNSFKKKQHGHDDNSTPTWGVTLDDDYYDDAEEPEYYGAPMYESENAPKDMKETAKQHPREDVVISEKHIIDSPQKKVISSQNNVDSPQKKTTISPRNNEDSPQKKIISPQNNEDMSPSKKTNESPRTGKFPTVEVVTTRKPIGESVRTKKVAQPEPINTNKTLANPLPQQEARAKNIADSLAPLEGLNTSKTFTESVTDTLSPAYAKASEATQRFTSKLHDMAIATSTAFTGKDEASRSEQKWDKGVSVREYLMQKFEPGEEERALSEVISETISPTKKPGDKTVVEKVRGVVSSLLASNEPTTASIAMKKSASIPVSRNAYESNIAPTEPSMKKSASIAVSTSIPISTNATSIPISTNAANIPVTRNVYEVVEEKTEGRILQTN